MVCPVSASVYSKEMKAMSMSLARFFQPWRPKLCPGLCQLFITSDWLYFKNAFLTELKFHMNTMSQLIGMLQFIKKSFDRVTKFVF